MTEYILSTSHLEEWLEKPAKIHIFWESKKAQHAGKLEALELYVQHAIDQVRQLTLE